MKTQRNTCYEHLVLFGSKSNKRKFNTVLEFVFILISSLLINGCKDLKLELSAYKAIDNNEYDKADSLANKYEEWIMNGLHGGIRYSNPETDSTLASAYTTLADIYFSCLNFPKAFDNAQKAANITRKNGRISKKEKISTELMLAKAAYMFNKKDIALESNSNAESMIKSIFRGDSKSRNDFFYYAKEVADNYLLMNESEKKLNYALELRTTFNENKFKPLKENQLAQSIDVLRNTPEYFNLLNYFTLCDIIAFSYIDVGEYGSAYFETRKAVLLEKYLLSNTNYATSEELTLAYRLFLTGHYREALKLEDETIKEYNQKPLSKNVEKENFSILKSNYAIHLLFAPDEVTGDKNYSLIDSVLTNELKNLAKLKNKDKVRLFNLYSALAESQLKQNKISEATYTISKADSLLGKNYLTLRFIQITPLLRVYTDLHFKLSLAQKNYNDCIEIIKRLETVPALSQYDKYNINSKKMELSFYYKIPIDDNLAKDNLNYLEQNVFKHYDIFSLENTIEYFSGFKKDEDILIAYLNAHNDDKTVVEYFRKRKNFYSLANSRLLDSLNKTNNKDLIEKYFELKSRKLWIEKLYSQTSPNEYDKILVAEEKFKDDKNDFLRSLYKERNTKSTQLNWGVQDEQFHIGGARFFPEAKIKTLELQQHESLLEIYTGNVFNGEENKFIDSYYFFISNENEPVKKIIVNREKVDEFINNVSYDYSDYSSSSKTYSKEELFSFWKMLPKPIYDLFASTKPTYIIPTGNFQRFSWEMLPIKDKPGYTYLAEIKPIYYLNSYHSLNKKSVTAIDSNDKFCLLGNPNFYAESRSSNINSFEKDRTSTGLIFGSENIEKNYFKSIRLEELPSTKSEILSIAPILTSNKLEVHIFLQDLASEFNVKKNLGAPTVLHLATHGFYEKGKNWLKQITPTNFEPPLNFFNPQKKTGLFLSGAGTFIDKNLTYYGEDGILTSEEVSALNLINIKLLVLSACQTSDGEEAGLEGFCSLEKAAANAGVARIITSMWKVNDAFTAEFMKRFYRNWINESDIYSAFRKTKLSFINKNEVYNSPKYWASFELIIN